MRARAVVVVAGIGSVLDRGSSFLRAGLLTRGDLARLRAQGAVGEMVGRFYKIDGTMDGIDINQRIIGVELDDLRRVPYSLAVARGLHKLKPFWARCAGVTCRCLPPTTLRPAACFAHARSFERVAMSSVSSPPALSLHDAEQALSSFDAATRAAALQTLLTAQPQPPQAWQPVANMHCHTFFSFNTYGYSPTSLARLAPAGLAADGADRL